jgi:uncharacterized protein YukE
MGGPTSGTRLHVDFDVLDEIIAAINTVIDAFRQSSSKYDQTVQSTGQSWQGQASRAFNQALEECSVRQNNEQAAQMAETLRNNCMKIQQTALQADAQAAQILTSMVNNVIKSVGDGLQTAARNQ